MSIRIISEVIETAGIKSGDLVVLILLADCADTGSRQCWPSVRYLARRARLTERQTQRCLKNLEASGFITVERSENRYGTNLYTILPEGKWTSKLRGDNLSGGDMDVARGDAGVATRGDTGVVSGVTPMSPKPSIDPSEEEPSEDPPQSPQGGLFGSEQIQEGVKDPDKGESAMKKETDSDAFARFWQAYPKCKRKTDKPIAAAVFSNIIHGKAKGITKTDPETVIAGAQAYAATNPDPEYIPQPARWLRGARWEQHKPAEAVDHSSWITKAKALVLAELKLPAGLSQEGRMAFRNIRMVEPNWRPQEC